MAQQLDLWSTEKVVSLNLDTAKLPLLGPTPYSILALYKRVYQTDKCK